MSRSPFVRSAALMTAIAAGACSVDHPAGPDGDPMSAPTAPEAPQLRVTGRLRSIHLSWSASTGALGYRVYRSVDGIEFGRRNDELVTQPSFDDAIESPAGDGVLYRYRVTAVAALESAPSNIVQTMHGTRLPASSTLFSTVVAQSPYVAEGTSTCYGLRVERGTKLYLLDGAVLDFESRTELIVAGLIRATPSASAPARFTAHRRDGGPFDNAEGFHFRFSGVPYQPSDGSGSVLEHVEISHLATPSFSTVPSGAMVIAGSGLRLANVKISGSRATGETFIFVENNGWVIVEHSYLYKVGVAIGNDVRNTPFRVAHNVFRNSADSLWFSVVAIPALGAGQFEQNDLNGTKHVGVSPQVTGAGSIPVGNNYWGGGTGRPPPPGTPPGTQPISFDFHTPSPALVEPPDAGPDW